MEMKYPWMNASGILSHPDVLYRMADCFGAVVLKSTGPKERQGNQTRIFYKDVNAVGLPNPGRENVRSELKEYCIRFARSGTPVIASVFGNSPDELAHVIELLDEFCNAIELNYSCPNIKRGEKTGVTIGKSPSLIRRCTKKARSATHKTLIAKMTPAAHIYDPALGVDVAKAALDAGADAISAINTVPGAMRIDIYARTPVLSAKYGGLSGHGIKPLGVGYIYSLRDALGPNVPLIGMGGIEEPQDVVEYMMAGASAVAIGTALAGKSETERRSFMKSMELGFRELLPKLGIENMDELRGAAHREVI